MKKVLKIGARDLVEQVLRTGDLNFDFFVQNKAIDGIRAHQHIQKKRSGRYQPEVAISYCHESPSYTLEIGGRIDGVLCQSDSVLIEEIKTTSRKVDSAEGYQNPIHWGQLKAYMYIYAATHAVTELQGQLTYVHPETWQEWSFQQSFQIEELKSFFTGLIENYLKWADHRATWQDIRTRSIQSLAFPFTEYRQGQRQMAVAVFRTIKRRDKILIQAPTGIGKTMATIFPAVKALGEDNLGTLFYLTARTTGRVSAEKVFNLLEKNDLRFKTVTLTAKDKICFNTQKDCNPDVCQFAKGYYDRCNDAIWSGLKFDRLNRQRIEALAKEFMVCPFEFSLDISQWADGIICDYNYAFDPRVYLRRYFSDGVGQHILLVDEAHNLPERAREMFSAQIAKRPFLELRKKVKTELQGLYRCLNRINRWFLNIAKSASEETDQWSEKPAPADLTPLLNKFIQLSEKWLRLNIPAVYREDLLEQYFTVLSFLRVMDLFDDSYAACYSKEKKDLILRLFCIDPSRQLAQALKRGAATVFFSATLTPFSYFQSLFGCDTDIEYLSLPSPFPHKNFALFRAGHISTYFRHREKSCAVLCELLQDFINIKQGNYLLFFPSYNYLTMIHSLFTSAQGDMDVISQTPGMSENERRNFLTRFQNDNSRTLVGFAVLGGIFGEGIALMGNRLCGAAVVGVVLPGISLERELIRKYYEQEKKLGFEFAYQFPGINRVLQAAGRVIRSEKDRGVVLLVDTRFAKPSYASLLPHHWHAIPIFSTSGLRMGLKGFWEAV